MPTLVESDIAGGGNDYDTISLWEADTDNDLVTADEKQIAYLFNGNSPYVGSTGLVFEGATTDATRYRELAAKSGSEHTGMKNTGAWMHQDTAGYPCVRIAEDFFRCTNIEADGLDAGSPGAYGFAVWADVEGIIIDGCLAYAWSYYGFPVIVAPTHANTQVTWKNCAGFNSVYGEFRGASAGTADQALAHFCTGVHKEADTNVAVTGFRYLTAVNCGAFHYGDIAGHGDYLNLDAGSSNNCSHDATGDTASLVAADQFVDITDDAMDLTLKSGSGMEGVGTNISGITTDWEGDARHATAPDCGWDEFVAAVGANPKGIFGHPLVGALGGPI